MTKRQQYRFRLELVVSVLAGVLAVLTAIWHNWIEEVFHVDPDAGSGALEWVIVLALALIALSLGAHARKSYVRAVGTGAG
jgi:hypothetical protein